MRFWRKRRLHSRLEPWLQIMVVRFRADHELTLIHGNWNFELVRSLQVIQGYCE